MKSVSKYLEPYFSFDAEFISLKIAISNILKRIKDKEEYLFYKTIVKGSNNGVYKYSEISKYKHLIKEERNNILNKWREKKENGIKIHKLFEETNNNNVVKQHEYQNYNNINNVFIDGIYKEKLISYNGVVGKPDEFIIFTKNEKRYVNIVEYKVIDNFNFKSVYNLKEPLNHLDNSAYTKASLQLSFYVWIFINNGYIPQSIEIIQILNNNNKIVKINHIPLILLNEVKLIIKNHDL